MTRHSKHEPPERIEELKKHLYSPSGNNHRHGTNVLHEESHDDIPKDWQHSNKHMNPKPKRSLLNTIFIIAVIFFLGAFAFAFVSMQSGFNTVSSTNISISVSGPSLAKAGEVLELEIGIRNDNEVDMISPTLVVEFPDGTRSPEDTSKALNRLVLPLEDIRSGDQHEQLATFILYGKEGDQRDIQISVEYRVPGSGATFSKDKMYSLTISESPLSLTISGPREVSSGQDVTLNVEIESEAEETLENILLVAEYPFGFEFLSGEVKPTFDSNVWLLGDLEQGAKKSIKIHGRISGQRDEERIFRFEIGTQSPRNEKIVGTPFATYMRSITLRQPVIDLSLLLDGESENEHTVGGTTPVRMDITWKNNTNSSLRDVTLSAQLEGNLYDANSISVSRGQFRQDSGTIVWNKSTEPRFTEVNAGESGTVSFEFIPQVTSVSAPTMTITAEFNGSSATGNVKVSRSTSISVASNIDVRTEIDVSDGANPPQEGQSSDYIVTFILNNSVHDVGNVEVTAVLPTYAEWLNVTSGAGKFEYTEVGGQITWILGDIDASKSEQAQFKVRVTPRDDGDIPIIERIRAQGTDLYTSSSISDTAEDIIVNVE